MWCVARVTILVLSNYAHFYESIINMFNLFTQLRTLVPIGGVSLKNITFSWEG